MTYQTHTKKIAGRNRRSARTRAKLQGTSQRPRLSVYKSNKHIYAQIINDEKGITVVASSDFALSSRGKGKKVSMRALAAEVGSDVAQKAKKKNIVSVVFDRGRFLYTGVIRDLADAARKEGLQF